MRLSEAKAKKVTLSQYFNSEERAEVKHEFHNGKLIPMPGGTFYHNKIINNIIFALNLALEDKEDIFHILGSDMKILIPAWQHVVYPDAVVIARAPEFYEDRKDVILNPLLIVEVLSAGTESYDRGTKFEKYQSIPSFCEYVLVRQDKAEVQTYYREEADLWKRSDFISPDGLISLLSVAVALEMSRIYKGIVF
jgi:Uma2 family endonuclease